MKDTFLNNFPKYLWVFAFGYLLVIYFLSWLIDFKEIELIGISEWVSYQYPNLFWIHVFREGSITENLQWLFLGFTALSLLLLVATFKETAIRGYFALLFGTVLMFIEDKYNVRHKLNDRIGALIHGENVNLYEWKTSIYGASVEMIFYALLGTIMLYAFYSIYVKSEISQQSKKYLLAGYIFYFIASFGSATRNLFDWYAHVGGAILNLLTSFKDLTWSGDSMIYYRDPLGFWFMDFVIEESLELMGATFLLSSVLICFNQLSLKNSVQK
ncbi:MAG: hypothetical protein LAT80_15525 [Balneolaceae bacterium]|nr:hypothetical protein [Balneolaceae bacterium]